MSAITEQGMSRRNFLAGMAGVAGLAAAGLAGCSSAGGSKEASGSDASGLPEKWDGEYDVIVCGGGGSGLTAAYSALENGAEKVLVLEKAAACGGTTALAEGAVQASGTQWQKEIAGVTDDSAELHKKEVLAHRRRGHREGRPRRVHGEKRAR